MHASMYFRFGNLARPGIKGQTCFEAVKNKERSSTTRFEKDSPAQFQRWQALRVGDHVTFWSGRWNPSTKAFDGESITCIITEAPRLINLRNLNPLQRENWSRAEGWAPTWIDQHLAKGGPEIGLQVRYNPI